MASTAPSPGFRTLLESHFARLRELESALRDDIAALLAETSARSRSDLAVELNHAIRCLRQANGFGDIADAVAEAALKFSNCAAVLSLEGDLLKGRSLRGADSAAAERFRTLEFPLSSAAALAGAVETKDTQVCLIRAAGMPETLRAFFPAADDRAGVFPLLVNGQAVAVLCASGALELAALELLAQVAGAVLQGRAARRAGPPAPRKWSELTAEDQQLHLRAQHFARVEVARLRLYAAGAVKSGCEQRNLYAALRKEIDSARETFRERFLSASTTMVDYFHLELLRNLANEDPALLGEDYPGPLV